MGLQGALVDRARVVEKRGTGVRVEGRTVYGDAKGEWFRCRLTLPNAEEGTAAVTGARNVVVSPQLLYGTRDQAGDPVVLNNAMRLEVDSADLGPSVWEVVSEPEPLRKKRRVIGHQATVRHLETHEAAA